MIFRFNSLLRWIFCFYLISLHSTSSYSLTMDQAVETGFKHSDFESIHRLEGMIQAENAKQVARSFLPSLSVKRSYEDSSLFDPEKDSSMSRTCKNTASLSFNLPSLVKSYYDGHINVLEKQFLSLKQKEEIIEHKNLLRKLFINLFFKQKELDHYQEIIRQYKKLVEFSQLKFTRGVSQKADLLRLNIQLRNNQQNLDDIRLVLQKDFAFFKSQLGLNTNQEVILDFSIERFLASNFNSFISQHRQANQPTVKYQMFKKRFEIEKLKLNQTKSDFLPSFNMAYHAENVLGQSKSFFTIGVEFKIFDQLGTYSEYNRDSMKQQIDKIHLDKTLEYDKVDEKHLFMDLEAILVQLKTKKAILDDFKILYEMSKEKYQSGVLKAQELIADLTSYYFQVNDYHSELKHLCLHMISIASFLNDDSFLSQFFSSP